jgi:hypothetical protein
VDVRCSGANGTAGFCSLIAVSVDQLTGFVFAHRRTRIYYENERGRQPAAKLLSKDEARRIAANVAKLPVTTLTLFRARINSRQNHDLP